ncbi:hypothetical protein RINTHM_10670 [Richelia intracellularis HM01]|nr:hypothetical protein RINTHM_10670 [Richelia intracellularis HM01]
MKVKIETNKLAKFLCPLKLYFSYSSIAEKMPQRILQGLTRVHLPLLSTRARTSYPEFVTKIPNFL